MNPEDDDDDDDDVNLLFGYAQCTGHRDTVHRDEQFFRDPKTNTEHLFPRWGDVLLLCCQTSDHCY